jgi:hypothetical protein
MVPPKRKLIAISPQVATADVVKDAVDTALQQREKALGGIRGDVAYRVDSRP